LKPTIFCLQLSLPHYCSFQYYNTTLSKFTKAFHFNLAAFWGQPEIIFMLAQLFRKITEFWNCWKFILFLNYHILIIWGNFIVIIPYMQTVYLHWSWSELFCVILSSCVMGHGGCRQFVCMHTCTPHYCRCTHFTYCDFLWGFSWRKCHATTKIYKNIWKL
jgi:hypothetical protein